MSHDLLATTTLRQRAAARVGDAHLGAVLRSFTDSLGERLDAATAAIANYDELKEAARAQRSAIVARLPEVLERFADSLQRNGVHVHWAAEADDACRYVAAVAASADARLAVKAKSMVTEEIGLNDRLADAGVEVVETDLGEYIVQLARQMPSHILAPAIHMSRQDVADVFNRFGDGDLSAVPAELAAFARARLREQFLTADLGISGVNFGIAETGTLVIVTNEGNGRMVTSVPRTHVALIGMERVLDDWAQLDLLMTLLPRAAVGQDISVYVNHITGPRRAGEVDGPDDLHVVIVDNGRSALLGSQYQEMLNCIRCGACLNVCPVYRQIGGHGYGWVYSGPMGAVLTPLLHRSENARELPQASSLCGACHEVCPVGIPLQDLLLRLRQDRAATDAGVLERSAWAAWAQAWSRPSTYAATTRAAALAGRVIPQGLAPHGWTDSRDLPRPEPGPSFRARLRRGDV